MNEGSIYDLPPVEDMIPSEDIMQQHLRLQIAMRENADLDEAIRHLIKASNKLCAAFLTTQGIIEDLVEIPKEDAYKRIERATRTLWTYLLAIRTNAGIENTGQVTEKEGACRG